MPRRLSEDEISAINERVLGIKTESKPNPFTTKRANPFTQGKLKTEVVLREDVDKARKRLFKAGWSPAQLEVNVTDEQRELLIKLHHASRELTMGMIRIKRL